MELFLVEKIKNGFSSPPVQSEFHSKTMFSLILWKTLGKPLTSGSSIPHWCNKKGLTEWSLCPFHHKKKKKTKPIRFSVLLRIQLMFHKNELKWPVFTAMGWGKEQKILDRSRRKQVSVSNTFWKKKKSIHFSFRNPPPSSPSKKIMVF